MKRIKTQQEFIRGMSRKDLNAYIQKVSKLAAEAKETNNLHNYAIYSNWTSIAINEARRREKAKQVWIEHIAEHEFKRKSGN